MDEAIQSVTSDPNFEKWREAWNEVERGSPNHNFRDYPSDKQLEAIGYTVETVEDYKNSKFISDMVSLAAAGVDFYSLQPQKPKKFQILKVSELIRNPLPLSPEIIQGVLRKGHKMMLTGSSKAGKTWCLVDLSVSFASGNRWLGSWCKQSKVLYLNLEVDPASMIKRFNDVMKAKHVRPEEIANHLDMIPLRGQAKTIFEMSNKIIEIAGSVYDVIIIDPLYKVQGGDENSAGDIGKFTNELDKIATQTGASIIYAHHHTKGDQTNRKAKDRGSGSGVFARDADALVDLLEVGELSNEEMTAFQIEYTTREFRTPPIKYAWFDFPLFTEDPQIPGKLQEIELRKKEEADLLKELKKQDKKQIAILKNDHLMKVAFDKLNDGSGIVDRSEIAKELNIKKLDTITSWAKDSYLFNYKRGKISLK